MSSPIWRTAPATGSISRGIVKNVHIEEGPQTSSLPETPVTQRLYNPFVWRSLPNLAQGWGMRRFGNQIDWPIWYWYARGKSDNVPKWTNTDKFYSATAVPMVVYLYVYICIDVHRLELSYLSACLESLDLDPYRSLQHQPPSAPQKKKEKKCAAQ